MFQSTRPRGARHTRQSLRPYRQCFNPRARGGRDTFNAISSRVSCCFNPRARGGRDADCGRLAGTRTVSIHAPAGGATVVFHDYESFVKFQSTRPRGARLCHAQRTSRRTRFNPRARGGRDASAALGSPSELVFQSTRPRGARRKKGEVLAGLQVSIHAPAGGATSRTRALPPPCVSFNPRARGGRDPLGKPLFKADFWFQSTRPRGARHNVGNTRHPFYMFQSTRPRGARLTMTLRVRRAKTVSIHAPAGGATPLSCQQRRTRSSFNPRARGGRDVD